MARLPPDEDTVGNHCERVNYLSFCLKHFDLLKHPSPIGHGYVHMNGRCRPVRYNRPAMPERVDVHYDTVVSESDESGSEYGDSSDDSEDEL